MRESRGAENYVVPYHISTYDVRDVAGWYQEGAGWVLFGIWGHIHTALHDAEFAVELCNASTAHTVKLS